MQPSIGRIVHYVSYGTPGGEFTSQCRAAVITEVDVLPDGELPAGTPYEGVGLCVVNPTGLFFHRHVGHDDLGHLAGTWHWPERVPE